jgi:hypothetical protein
MVSVIAAIGSFFSIRRRKTTPPSDSNENSFAISGEIAFVENPPSNSELNPQMESSNEESNTTKAYSGSIDKTGAGSKIPKTRKKKLSEQQKDGSNAFGQIVEEAGIILPNPQIQVFKTATKVSFAIDDSDNPPVKPHSNDVLAESFAFTPHKVTSINDNTLDLFGQIITPEQIEINAREEAEAEERARLETEERARQEAEAKREEEEEARALAEEAAKAKALAEAEAERVRLTEEERTRQEAKTLEEERARREGELAAAEAKRQKEESVKLENMQTDTPTDESDEEKQQRIKNQVLSEIINNNALDEKTLAELWADLWEDFSSNQNYTTNDTTNTTNAISSNNTKDSTSEKQKSIPPTRAPLPENKYITKLTPKTYFGVGIKTQLVQEENQPSYLNITQFYDDSGFKSALKDKDPKIETDNQNIKITAIECDWDENGKKAYYSIDQIFEKCGKDEMNFNLKLCDIFRNLKENELKLKFSIDGGLQDQDLNIKKSVFTKGENNEEYKNIKTVIKQQTVIRKPHDAVTNPQNLGRPADNQTSYAQSVVG